MNALIVYKENKFEIMDFTFSPEDVAMGNPYNCSFKLKIVSGAFSGTAPCEYDIKEFRRFIAELKELYLFKRDSVDLSEICYGSHVRFSLDKYGHIGVSGTIYGESMEHMLKFIFTIDQTVFPDFIAQLEMITQI